MTQISLLKTHYNSYDIYTRKIHLILTTLLTVVAQISYVLFFIFIINKDKICLKIDKDNVCNFNVNKKFFN